jgi:hypothetical protein
VTRVAEQSTAAAGGPCANAFKLPRSRPPAAFGRVPRPPAAHRTSPDRESASCGWARMRAPLQADGGGITERRSPPRDRATEPGRAGSLPPGPAQASVRIHG